MRTGEMRYATCVIVEADSAQAPFIVDIRRWFAEEHGVIPLPIRFEAVEAEMKARRYRAWVHLEKVGQSYDEEMTSVIGIAVAGDEARVTDLFVRPPWREQGIARALIVQLGKEAMGGVAPLSRLYVPGRWPAAELFEAAGWIRSGELLELRP